MKDAKQLSVLISSFACGPNWGSEVGMGWNWITHLSQYCKLYIITEKGFKDEIERGIANLNLQYTPTFYYIDIGDKGRKLFWKQGSLSFYYYYKKWQKKAFLQSKEVISENKIDLIHQLNLIGFREPGYLWKFSKEIPFIWGPIGGFNQVPLNYIFKFSFKNKLFYLGKHIIHLFQMHFYRRVKKALNSASIVFAESSTTKSILSKVYHINAVQMNETGADLDNFSKHDSFCINNIFHILWVGKIQGLKGLPIALQTLAALKNKVKAKMTVIGDGPDEMACRKLTKKLDLDTNVTFLGKIPNVEVRKLMKNNDILFFTSLKEGTPHVVLEALSSGLPVVCHNACGHGDIVNSTCGIKIPMISHNNSITHFTRSLINLYNDKSKLEEFSKGTKLCVEHYSWENKTKTMVEYYKRVASR